MRNRLFYTKGRSAVMDLWSLWLSLFMFWTLCSKWLFWYFRIWIIIIIRLNFWFGFRIGLLLVLGKLRILFNWLLLIIMIHSSIMLNFWVIAVTFVAWFFLLLNFLTWRCLNLLLACFVLLSVHHQLFITIDTVFPLIFHFHFLNWLLLLRNHVLIFMLSFHDLFWLEHILLYLHWHLNTLITFIRMT